MSVAPIVISRSAVATRKLCEMKRYWAYHAMHPDMPATDQVGGMAPTRGALGETARRGQLIHGCMDRLIKGEDWSAWLESEMQPSIIAAKLTGQMETEEETLLRLVSRAVMGWNHQRGYLLNDFTPVSSEEEWTWSLHPMVAQTLRLDQIWRRKTDNALLIVDFKTLGRPDMNWIARLRNSDQTHLYIKALQERSGEDVLGIQYEGIIVGVKEDGMVKSPFVRVYQHAQTGAQSHKYKSGWTSVPTIQWTDAAWFHWANQNSVLHDLYCSTGIISINDTQLSQTKAATVKAEIEWADKMAQIEAHPHLLPMLVERSPDACLKYGAGYACAYGGLCWEGHQPDSDSFTPRVDHHAV